MGRFPAFLVLLLVAAACPARGDLPVEVQVAIAGGRRVAVPDQGPELLLVPFEARLVVSPEARYEEIGFQVEAFEVRKIKRERDPGFHYPRVEGSAFRIENLSPVRLSLKRGEEASVRFQIQIPRTVAPGIYFFRARVSGDENANSDFFDLEIVRGAADVDLAPVAIDEIEEDGTPESAHPLRFTLKVANEGHHAWAASAKARVVVHGEGEERVEKEVAIGIVPGRTRVSVPVEVEVLQPRRIEVVVDPAGILPESNEANNETGADTPGQ